ncbi:MAG: hypothetical protein AB7E04_11240 [Desulfobacteraceae bacterium]
MSSTFPILDPLNIELSFTSVYPIPEAGTVLTLRFGVTGDIEIVSSSSNVVIVDSGSQISAMTVILSEDSQIVLKSSSSEIQVIIEIYSQNSEIKISSSSSLVEHLPDIEIAGSEIIINLSESIISGGQANDLPGYVRTGDMDFIWNNVPEKVESSKSFFWNKPDDLLLKEKIIWDKTTETDKKTSSPFLANMAYFDFKNIAAYSNFQNKSDFENTASFLSKMIFTDEFHSHLWDEFFIRDHDAEFPYDNFKWFEFKDTRHFTLFDKSEYWNKRFENKFDNGNDILADNHHGTFWGPYWYSLWCEQKYFPYKSNEFVRLSITDHLEQNIFPVLKFIYPDNPRCPFEYWHSGDRDSFSPDITPVDSVIVPRRKVWYMINTAYIKRLPDMADISFISVSASIDRDSWTWSFNITLNSRDSLDLVKPENGSLKDIEININGWKWTCRVENWSRDYSFGQEAWKVSGRSQSIELGDPYCIEPVFTNVQEHGGQIIDRILTNTGWTADWQYKDFNPYASWLVPASTLNMTDVSKIKQIQAVTDSVSAFIQTAADTATEKKLIIKPKYFKNPWHWINEPPSLILNDSISHEISSSSVITKPLDSVIVSGQNRGVIVNAVKNGAAGNSPAPMVFDDMITTQDAGRERARHIIGGSGIWIKHTLKLFSLMPPETPPGLMLPGDFIQMNESNISWKGQVTATAINASWNNGLTVNQDIEVEQYYE